MAWNGSNTTPKASSDKRPEKRGSVPQSALRYALAGGVGVVVLGGLAVWLLVGRDGARPAPARGEEPTVQSAIAEAKPSLAPTNAVKAVKTTSAAATNRNLRLWRGVEVVSSKASTNQSGAVVERLVLADGRKIDHVTPPKPLFPNPSDQLIALAVSAKPGQSMAPMPSLNGIDRDFANSLLEPIKINDSDSQEVKDLKLAVKEARAYIAAEIKNGRTVAECLQEHCAMMENISDSHTMAVQEIQKMKQDGATAEEIAAFRKRVNEVFKEKGIPELSDGKRKSDGDGTETAQEGQAEETNK